MDEKPSAAPTALSTEYAREALGVDVERPRLSWHLPRLDADGRQTAYRLRVGSWDSGKQASSANRIEYGGPPLASRTRYEWQVQTWDGGDRASAWSAPAWFETGLLQPSDWSAKWISGRTRVDHDWRDARVGVDFTLTGKSFGVLFRAKPAGKTYGEAYLWTIGEEGGRIRIAQQVRHYPGGSSSKVNVATLRTLTIGPATPEWLAARHRLSIETRGNQIVTRLDDGAPDTLTDAGIASGTVGFVASTDDAAIVHAVRIESEQGSFATDFTDGANPFTGGSVTPQGLRIAAGVPDKDLVLPIGAPAPLLRRAFDLPAAPARARLYVAAGGLPAITINGAAIGEAMQDGYTDYSKRVLVRTFDVTSHLRAGANVIAAELGRGWYGITEPNEWYWHLAPWHAAPALRAQLEITLADGRTFTVGSDERWRTIDGPTRHDSVYIGERYDARLAPAGWQEPGFDDGAWQPVTLVAGPAGTLHAAPQEPIAVTGSIAPIAMTEPKPGIHVFDFGRIFAGRLRLSVRGPRGATVRMIQTEKLRDDGTVAIGSGLVDGQLQTDQYTLAGDGLEQWSPKFGYRGFRYVQVEGYPGTPTLDALAGERMHSDVPQLAAFESSNELLNRIQAAARNTLLNNLHGNQTDTPTYEKNGWTGDAQASALASILNFGVERVWSKWLADFRDAQSPKGEIPEIVPSTPFYGYEDTPGWSAVWGPVPSWDAATFVLPWELYQQRGDRRILEQMYETQKKLVDYTGTYFTSGALAYRNPHNFLLGEYASVMPPGGLIAALRQQPNGPIDATASAYYFHMLDLLSRSAALLGKSEDEARYRALAQDVRAAYNARYFDAAGAYYRMPAPASGYAQTPNVLAVAFGLVPDGQAEAVMRRLNDDIVARGYQLGCGVYAGRYVMTLLSDHGYAGTAYRVATRREFPGWGYWLDHGLSTMAEGWELSSRSWDHHYWASISAWFYESLAGIRAAEPGYARAIIAPRIPAGLDWVRARVQTPFGPLASAWKRDAKGFTLEVDVPPGIDAEVRMPAGGAVHRVGMGHHVFAAG